ncbi:Piso0_004257 [Millerozyma farinosa CBS 7064]|uniref:Piso0_004257 protein n=1 Tax=Pichia sorbitophila (strain ATCC MYA-4447 / BCRC 22081 / CBS 7064 / NBRC 10061 / NRRL Y-12695) TaxID=559304 RepID=G8Y7X3_PICSO|nr:Piso0_004257 [Millerozyma farinosa CBS 7064]CCE84703.1 Piso0_004257 [Millerozyma farinosa CBS 7064]
MKSNSVRVAVEGCCHGMLNKIYDALPANVNLLIICGDFQALRNKADLQTISVPRKYRTMGDFHEYYSGRRKAPVLTIFIGGNHECSSYLKELRYGGWVAPNIYYLGEFGVVWYKGLRISGWSGIFNHSTFVNSALHYDNGREPLPYSAQSLRTVYHTKPKNYLKMLLMKDEAVDVVLSHDWPQHIEKKGDLAGLLKRKPFFATDVQRGHLGSPLNKVLFYSIKPRYWFCAHLHVYFDTIVDHAPSESEEILSGKPDEDIEKSNPNSDEDKAQKPVETEEVIDIDLDMDMDMDTDVDGNTSASGSKTAAASNNNPNSKRKQASATHFIALDKCLPKRKFLRVIDIDVSDVNKDHISYKKNVLALDRRATAINKIVEKLVGENDRALSHISFSDFIAFYRKHSAFYDELVEEVEHEVSSLDKIPNEEFVLDSKLFNPIAPDSSQKNVATKYWDNDQTKRYCSKFGVPFK